MGIKMDTVLNDGAPRLEVNDGYKYSLEIKIPDPNNAGKTITKRIPFLVDWDDIENKPNFTTGGNVIGPDSSTNNAVAVFDGVTGKVIKNSAATIDEYGLLTVNKISSSWKGALLPDNSYGYNIGSEECGWNELYALELRSPNRLILKSDEGPIVIAPHSLHNTYLSDGNRVNFGGKNLVASGKTVETILASKRAGNDGNMVDFAITAEGQVYYKGSEISNASNINGTVGYIPKFTDVSSIGDGWQAKDIVRVSHCDWQSNSYASGQLITLNTLAYWNGAHTGNNSSNLKYCERGTIASLSDIPTVNNGTLTIQKNGINIASFTANSNVSTIANITVPTKTSELNNDSGFITSAPNPANYYWANINVSTSSSTTTTPIFASVGIASKATWKYNSTDDCIELVWS